MTTKSNSPALEAAMVPIALYELRHQLKNRDIIFFIDNSTTLYAMLQGRCGQPVCARAAFIVCMLAKAYCMRIFWEFVPSAANWSDSISRKLEACPFCRRHAIPIHRCLVKDEWYSMSLDSLYKTLSVV